MKHYAQTICLSKKVISSGIPLTIFYQLTESEATSCNGFRDIFITSFLYLNLHWAITGKLQRAITRKNIIFFFTPGNTLIIHYQLYKCEDPSYYSFWNILITKLHFDPLKGT